MLQKALSQYYNNFLNTSLFGTERPSCIDSDITIGATPWSMTIDMSDFQAPTVL